MKRDLRFEVTYPHPPERVWHALTDAQAIAGWLMPNNFEPRVGHKFQFRTKPMPGWDGIVNCEVLECDPPRRLVYTWKSTLDTVLAITLEPVSGGTRLVLEHTGFRGVKPVLISLLMGSGWGRILRKYLPAVVERIEPDGTLRPLAAGEKAGCQAR